MSSQFRPPPGGTGAAASPAEDRGVAVAPDHGRPLQLVAGPTPPPVCLYTPSADPSGMGSHMVELAHEYVERGGAVTFMCGPAEPARRLLRRAARAGATPVQLPHPRDPRFGAVIAERLRSTPVDVFHIHVGTGREDFDGARAARAAGVPVVVETVHLPWLLSDPRKRVRFHRSIREVDHLVTVSEGQRATYERIGVPAPLLTTIPNGIRPRRAACTRAEARARLGLDPTGPVVMTVGRLTVMKGQRYLVESLPDLLAEFGDLSVVVVGAGHLRDALAQQASALGVSHALHLVGHRDDARQLLAAADVFTLPSRHEGMPLAVLEAMEARLPVVATDVTGTAEAVEDARTGLLVPPKDPARLAAALAILLRDPDLRSRMGAAGRHRFLEHHTATRMASATLALYDRLLAGRTAAAEVGG